MRRKLVENLKRVEQRIAEACRRAGRAPSQIKLVAVTKAAAIDVIRTLVDMGVTELGESRVQELTRRAAMLSEWLSRRALDPTLAAKPKPRWHMVGHLQRNKVKAVLPWVDLIHSVDSLRLAEEIDLHSRALGRKTAILLQINAGDEPRKFGVAVPAAIHLAEQICSLSNVSLRGLMAMAPLTEDRPRIRRVFERVREIFDEIVESGTCGQEFRELSMGMSHDFEEAVELGTTMVRIGTALFEGLDLPSETVGVEVGEAEAP
jgi:hypothetical protein